MTALWVGTSWKMTKTLAQARAWTRDLLADGVLDRVEGVQAFVIPSATALTAVAEIVGQDPRLLLGVQNAHWEDAGPWTGEISVPQAADAGARIVEIGHSERREHFGETVATTALKVRAALRHGLIPLLCIGEPGAVHDHGDPSAYVLEQVHGALDGLDPTDLAQVVLAYEPIWAIGDSGRPARAEELAGTVAALDTAFGAKVRALVYGGSVTPDNAEELLDVPGVGGLFVGRAAWDVRGYVRLLELAARRAA